MIKITKPNFFSFKECLWFLDRGYDECLYQVSGKSVARLIFIDGSAVVISVSETPLELCVDILNQNNPTQLMQDKVKAYVIDWFDMSLDLKPFYDLQEDTHLAKLFEDFKGLRLVGILDLFECLCWSIIGQQINLTFAYKLKRALVEKYGHSFIHGEVRHWHFPRPEDLKNITIEELKSIQFSKQKTSYIISLANNMSNPEHMKKQLQLMSPEKAVERLTSFHGIGQWSAHYVAMKCLRYKDAFPSTDAGLINAIRDRYQTESKPDQSTIIDISRKWSGWKAYATLYLWRSLSDKRF